MALGILLMGGPFRIATMIPNVTVEAVGQDALGITGAPVETGATMTDHSYKLPVRLEMVAGWSDSSAGYEGYIQEIYQRLLRLQATRMPFTIYTSRRMYPNMLMESITDPIGAHTFCSMLPRITFRELIISRTQTDSAATAKPASNQANQANPESTGSVVDRGTVQTQDVSAQAFAGAYNPGSQTPIGPGAYQVDGSAASGSFGLGGINPPAASMIDYGQLSGISPPMSITLPEISVTAGPETIGGLQAAGPDQYNIFGGGP